MDGQVTCHERADISPAGASMERLGKRLALLRERAKGGVSRNIGKEKPPGLARGFLIRRRHSPTLPLSQYHRPPWLNFCVRDGNRCIPRRMDTAKASGGLSLDGRGIKGIGIAVARIHRTGQGNLASSPVKGNDKCDQAFAR